MPTVISGLRDCRTCKTVDGVNSWRPWFKAKPAGTPCVFPFIWRGKKFSNCKRGEGWEDTVPEDPETFWCSTKLKPDGSGNHDGHSYAFCDDDCSQLLPGSGSLVAA